MNSPLDYTIHLPANREKEKKYPVIYAMHGKGSNEQNMLRLLQGLENDFILIGIRGGIPQGNGYEYFSIKSIGNPNRDSFDKSVKDIESFIEYAKQSYPIETNHQYLLGFSQGAILAMTLALTMGNQIKGIVALNGYVPLFVKDEYPIKSVEDLSIYISHGEYDPVFPLTIGKENEAYFREKSQNVHFTAYAVGHEVSYENQQEFIKWLYNDLRPKLTE
ncbi:alpha/beta hydrolase [Ammoniphilus sp. 3BR4]|uniref:alpha/beta hydrolase n=1 Tax=Ammoniphilus sp. 3BR4 TaxID=3158265 RepID=UPI0034651773